MSQRKVLPVKPTVAQLLIQFPVFTEHEVHYYFHHSLTYTVSPNFFISTIFFIHTYSSMKNIPIRAHIFRVLRMPWFHNKMWDKKS